MSLKKPGRNTIKMFGSHFISGLAWRDTWAFISQKRNKWIAEAHQKAPSLDVWASPVVVQAKIKLQNKGKDCHWGDDDAANRRKQFCAKYEGYGSVCSCKLQKLFVHSSFIIPLFLDLYDDIMSAVSS